MLGQFAKFAGLTDQSTIAMSVVKTYQPKNIEDKWYSYWMEKGYFNSTPMKENPTIVIPPPNVTGVLHMGHMPNNTLGDVLDSKSPYAKATMPVGYLVPTMLLLLPKPK